MDNKIRGIKNNLNTLRAINPLIPCALGRSWIRDLRSDRTDGEGVISVEYIEDKDLFKAVMFAKKMINSGQPAGLAIYKAARYYGVDQSEVARLAGQKRSSKKHS